jgi:predicted dinucleotide-binding enzyme
MKHESGGIQLSSNPVTVNATVTIIGAGQMSRSIATRLLSGGASVQILASEATKAEQLARELSDRDLGGSVHGDALSESVITGEIVILAVPFEAAKSIVRERGPQLRGRTVVDICNPMNPNKDGLLTPPGTSAAELLAAEAPAEVSVLKAFNTVLFPVLEAGTIAGRPVDVFIAGDDVNAKGRLAALLTAGGLRPLDAGDLTRARNLEAFQLVHIALLRTGVTDFPTAVAILS